MSGAISFQRRAERQAELIRMLREKLKAHKPETILEIIRTARALGSIDPEDEAAFDFAVKDFEQAVANLERGL